MTPDKLEALLLNYQTDAVKTALVTTPDKDLLIAACGLVGEYGEFTAMYNYRRQERDDYMKELGDVFWYVARLADLMNIQLHRLAWLPAFDDPQVSAFNSALVFGEICEYAKKTAGHGKYMTKPLVAMSQLLGYLVYRAGDNLEEVLKGNIEKLKARHPSGSFSNDYADRKLSLRDWETFEQEIASSEPNEKLRAAAEKYRAAEIHEMTNTTEGLSSKCGAEFGGFTLAPENVTCEECKKP